MREAKNAKICKVIFHILPSGTKFTALISLVPLITVGLRGEKCKNVFVFIGSVA